MENANYILDNVAKGQKHLTSIDEANEDDKLEITSFLFSMRGNLAVERNFFDIYFNQQSDKRPAGVTHDRRIDYRFFDKLGSRFKNKPGFNS